MKTLLAIIVVTAALAGAGYFGLPIIIEKETAPLKADIQGLKQKVQTLEDTAKGALLPPDANAQKIIQATNAMAARLNAFEDSFRKNSAASDEALKSQKAGIEVALKQQAEAFEKTSRDAETRTQKSMFNALMATVRGNVLKAKVELLAKNVGTAKNELDLIGEMIEKAKASAAAENRKSLEEFQEIIRKIKAEIDVDLPAAVNRVDLLWHEMSKLLRKV